MNAKESVASATPLALANCLNRREVAEVLTKAGGIDQRAWISFGVLFDATNGNIFQKMLVMCPFLLFILDGIMGLIFVSLFMDSGMDALRPTEDAFRFIAWMVILGGIISSTWFAIYPRIVNMLWVFWLITQTVNAISPFPFCCRFFP